jgi:DsbC/DsbD-like thiol-disulfide interchange protein
MHAIGSRVSRLSLTLVSGFALGLSTAVAVRAESAVPGASGPWVENEQARVRLVAARVAGPGGDPGGRIDLGLEFELAPDWHVYWKNSGDAGYPPRIDFSRTPALAGAQILFPAPRRYDLPGGLVSFGYEKHVIYPIAPIAPIAPISDQLPAAGGGKWPAVLARLDYLVCRAECIPHTAELSLDLDSARESSGPEGAATAARLAAAQEALPQDPASVAGAPQVSVRAEPGPASSLVLVFQATGGTLRAGGTDLFFEVHPFFALERPELSISQDGLLYRVPFRPLDETKPMPATTRFAWTLTGLERALSPADSIRGDAIDGGDGSEPSEVALAGSASVEIPHLRTSETGPAKGLRPGLVLPLVVAGLFLLLFALHRSRNRRS